MNAELLFPSNATKEELQIGWRLIAEISDNDFGFNNPKPIKGDKTRFNVRCILQNNSGEVCVVNLKGMAICRFQAAA